VILNSKDANGQLGPMFQCTLYRTIPPPIPPRKQFKSNRPNTKAMYERATSIPAPCGILLEAEADNNWKQTQKSQPTARRFFGHSYMAPTPSITTIQQIGIGIVHAYSSLILKATQNFKISDNMPGFDIFNFLLPHECRRKLKLMKATRPKKGFFPKKAFLALTRGFCPQTSQTMMSATSS